jgi:hypothetical protein
MTMYKTLAVSVFLFLSAATGHATDQPFNTNFDGIQFSIVEQAPHLNPVGLQTFGIFAYGPSDVFSGADIEMDAGLHGVVQDMRKNHRFEAKLGETILLKPNDTAIVPKQVLVMGLGDRTKLKVSDMKQIGATAIREACRLNMTEFGFAPDVQDGGGHLPPEKVTENVVTGMIQAIRLQKYLADKKMAEPCPVNRVILLAGPKFFEQTTKALTRATQSMGQPIALSER